MEQVFTNAEIVLPDSVVSGAVQVKDGLIADISTGSQSGEDLDGDYLLPGLVELHTDHLESHYAPRPGVRWNKELAIQAHDAQMASSGVTTVFDCFRVGTDHDMTFDDGEMRDLAVSVMDAQKKGRLRCDHRIHLRCEVSAPDALTGFNDFIAHCPIGLASLMDHAPGQRQFKTMDQYTLYYQTQRGLSDEEFADFVAMRKLESQTYSRPHREAIAAACRASGAVVASHDDATLDHVEEAVLDGVLVAEFPTSVEAARASRERGMSVLMGAPNVVRGGSHSGNIAASHLAELELLDVLSSDYIPLSLICAPFMLADTQDAISLADAVRMVSKTPAETVGMMDRGAIETGRRADLVRVQRQGQNVPTVRAVWRGGNRVC